MSFYKNLKHLFVIVSSFALGACQHIGAASSGPQPTVTHHPASSAWTPGELQWFTDYGEYLCKASSTPLAADPPAVDAHTLWQRVRAGYALDWRQEHPRIDAELKRFQANPHYLNRVSQRSERYLHYVVDALAERDMPLELALLPVIESAYDPFAYSHGRAAGMWQFIPGTAAHFGLKQNWWYDGRRDVVASTQAALNYLQQLHKTFDGDWLLALAAYNGGQGNVARAIKRNAAQGKPTDFWSLALSRETQAYVPRLLAMARLVHSPARYGVSLHPVSNEPYFAAVDTHGQIDLAKAAQLANIDIKELYLLNPGFNHWATDPEGPHQLLVPVAQAEILRTELAALPAGERLRWQRYQVRQGDSLIAIARKHAIDVNTLRAVNQLSSNLIRAGDALMIPSASDPKEAYVLSAAQRLSAVQNNPRGNGTQQYHTVRSGESFWSISRQYGVGVRELAKWNGMAPGDTLRRGQKLSVWTQSTPAAVQQAGPPRAAVVRKVSYRVRSGDSLARIAQRFRVGIDDIVQWNTLNPTHYLQPGQQLTLHVNVTRMVN